MFLAIAWVPLAGASCGDKSSAEPSESDPEAVVAAIDESTKEKEAAEPQKPIEGVDLSGLDDGDKELFDKLSASLVSPCGKAESLRRSATVSKDCKRSIFAARYLAMLIEEGATEDQVREFYGKRYVSNEAQEIPVSEATPRTGSPTAPVVIVEFMDYGCPACKSVKPVLDQVVENHAADVVLYYKQYPLTKHHPDSKGAAQAALAAGKQGKYEEMHALLFQKQGAHKKDALWTYAEQLGLDMEKFEADYAAAAAQVEKNVQEGEDLGVMGTPSIFVNGRKFEDLPDPRYFENWIAEELAVNR